MSTRQGDSFVIQPPGGAISFSTFVLGLASTAMSHLGVSANPETGTVVVALELAQESLELLDLLREKTRGNLSADEEKLLQSVLTDLKLRFVEARRPQS